MYPWARIQPPSLGSMALGLWMEYFISDIFASPERLVSILKVRKVGPGMGNDFSKGKDKGASSDWAEFQILYSWLRSLFSQNPQVPLQYGPGSPCCRTFLKIRALSFSLLTRLQFPSAVLSSFFMGPWLFLPCLTRVCNPPPRPSFCTE